jgi:glycosyltransferase involved in cell wall biosynthesis
MKVAFVNQPIDVILPPLQTSVGACTYGLAGALAKYCDVVVYGLEDRQPQSSRPPVVPGVRFRFLPSTRGDRLLFHIRTKMAKAGVRLAPDSTSNWQFRAFGRQVADDLRKENCDLIHLQHCSQYAPVIREKNPRAKLVLHLHAEWFSQNIDEWLRRSLAAVDLLTGVSNYVVGRAKSTFPSIAERCETTYNGIDPQEFRRDPSYTQGPNGGMRIMYAGAISPHKGIHILLEAFEKVLDRFPDATLNLIGVHAAYAPNETFDETDRDTLASLARFYEAHPIERLKARLGWAPRDAGTYVGHLKNRLSRRATPRVRILGMIPRSDLLEHYYASDVFVFPSVWNEGFGIPPLEAMAAGVPVVATRSGAVAETVVDGITGILIQKNDACALAEALTRFLCDDGLRRTMGQAGRRRALQEFTWDGIAADLHDRYRNLHSAGRAKGEYTSA